MYISQFIKSTAKTLSHLKKVWKKKEKIIFEPNIDMEVFFPTSEWKGKQNTSVYNHLVCIDGAGFCGSSAFTDYLGEYSNVSAYGGVDLRENPGRGKQHGYEVDFFREKGGILDLERICYTNVGRIRDNAVHEFIKVVVEYYNSGIPLYDDYFCYLCKKFVQNITNFVIHDSPTHLTYVPKNLSVKEYRGYAREMLTAFLKNIPSKEYLVMDNLMAISEPNTELLHDYFGDFKLLYVGCDPRDIFARARLLPGNDWVPVEPEVFVKSFKRILPYYEKSKDESILYVNFDEFCNDYENVSEKLKDFLGLREENHIDKFKYFDPKVSIHNTQVYNKISNQEAINYIYNNLREYCFNPE